MQAGLINRSATLSGLDLAFMAKAVSQQGVDFARDWGIETTPLVFYAREAGLPNDVRIMSVVDDVSAAGTLGFHDEWAGIISAQALAMGARTSRIISHEHLEMMKDPKCNLWWPMPDGKRWTAVEVCDAVQEDSYFVDVDIMGERRSIEVSNYILPAWFDEKSTGPWDKMGRLRGPFTMSPGGYLIVRDAKRNVSNVFAAGMPAAFGYKLANPISRTLRRTGNRGGDAQ